MSQAVSGPALAEGAIQARERDVPLTDRERAAPAIGAARLALVFLWLGSIGGRTASYLLSILMFGQETPAGLAGLMKGFSATLGMLAYTSSPTAGAVKTGGIGTVLNALTFVAYGLMDIGLLTVCIMSGAAAIFLHRPRPHRSREEAP